LAPDTDREPARRVHRTRGGRRQTARSAGRDAKPLASRPASRPARKEANRTGAGADGDTPRRSSKRLTARLNRFISQQWVQSLVLGPVGSFLLILIGLRDPPKRVPAAEFIRDHPLPTLLLAICGFLVVAGSAGLYRLRHQRVRAASDAERVTSWLKRAFALTTTLATFSTSGVVILASMVLIRPSWCPEVLCPQPPGPHDANLEAGFTALQSSDYVIAGDPAAYSLSHLPASNSVDAVPAAPVDGAATLDSTPYRLVLRVHSLQRGGVGMVLEAVTIQVLQPQPVPNPLRVWHKGQPLVYQVNPYEAVYTGQASGGQVTAAYSGTVRIGRVQLAPGESDELSIGIHASQPVSLSFQVWLTYRIANEDGLRTLKLPYLLTIAFSDALNWHTYQLRGGRLVPA
jgi:hypothetical protein